MSELSKNGATWRPYFDNAVIVKIFGLQFYIYPPEVLAALRTVTPG